MINKVLFLILLALPFTVSAQCLSPLSKPYKSTGQGYYYVIEVSKNVLGQRPHRHFKYLTRFQREVKHKTFVDPIFLLEAQLKFYYDVEEERVRFEKVIDGQVGKIRSVNCLEALLLDSHFGQFGSSSEFQAFVFSKRNSNALRVLVSTQNSKVSVGPDERIHRIKASYYRKGWKLERHLHNHPFSFNNPYGDIAGTVIPSPTDLTTYQWLKRNEGLKSGSVTNGFDTFDLRASEFEGL